MSSTLFPVYSRETTLAGVDDTFRESIINQRTNDSYHHLITLSFILHPAFVLAFPISTHFRFPHV